MDSLHSAEEKWDRADVDQIRSVSWLSLLPVAFDIHFGFSAEGFINHTLRLLSERRPGDDLTGAALVCGDMATERQFFEHTAHVTFRRVDGFDLSQVSLDRYVPDGIEWHAHKTDCNFLELSPDTYDLVVASHGAHHVMNLDNLFAQARSGLKERGLMYMYEWIGPPYLQIPRRNRMVATALLYLLFPRRKMRTTHMARVKGVRYIQDSPATMDPSEACNSLGLYPAFLRNFTPITEYKHGALTYAMFEGLAHVVAADEKRNNKRVNLVLRIEKWLTQRGLVTPLFVVVVGERIP